MNPTPAPVADCQSEYDDLIECWGTVPECDDSCPDGDDSLPEQECEDLTEFFDSGDGCCDPTPAPISDPARRGLGLDADDCDRLLEEFKVRFIIGDQRCPSGF